jgi:hypothetical protein
MFAELLQEMQKQAQQTLAPQVVQFDPTLDHAYRLPDGTLEFVAAEKKRNHRIETLADLAEFSKRFTDAADASFWYSENGVVFCVDDAHRDDKARIYLPSSPQWLAVLDLAKGKAMSQRDLIQLLRTTFRDCLGKAGDLVKNLREIRWKSAEDGSSTVQRGKASIGKTIQQEIAGLGEIPEYVTLTVPFWANRVLVYVDVECSLDPDEATQTFKFVPLPGKIDRAVEMALDYLQEAVIRSFGVEGSPFPIYRGSVD